MSESTPAEGAPEIQPTAVVVSRIASDYPAARKIESEAETLNSLAAKLSEQIASFLRWINRLPGRLETVWWQNPNPEAHSFGLKLHRSGKEWTVSFAQYDPTPTGFFGINGRPRREDTKWASLAESSLQDRIAALNSFPFLVEALAVEQQKKINEMRAASDAFDQFSRVAGIEAGEGK